MGAYYNLRCWAETRRWFRRLVVVSQPQLFGRTWQYGDQRISRSCGRIDEANLITYSSQIGPPKTLAGRSKVRMFGVKLTTIQVQTANFGHRGRRPNDNPENRSYYLYILTPISIFRFPDCDLFFHSSLVVLIICSYSQKTQDIYYTQNYYLYYYFL